MNALQITLFLIANVVFISQASRNIHHLVFGAEVSVLDRFSPEREQARSEAQLDVLLADYEAVFNEIRALEHGKKHAEVQDLQQQHSDLYAKKYALQSEIQDREQKAEEMRDTWIFSAWGLLLIIAGGVLYRRGMIWPGFAILVTGFCILEYWASPALFGGGAVEEYHQLLVSKTVLTLSALAALYLFWTFRGAQNKTLPETAAAPAS